MGAVCDEKRANRAEQLTEELLVLATERGANIKLPTMQELCSRYDVARGTLERALAPLEQRGLLYRRHGSGIYVSPTIAQKTVGLVFGGDIFSPGYSPFWNLLLQAVRGQAREQGQSLRGYFDVAETAGDFGGQAQLIEDLDARRLDGVLLLSPQYYRDEAGLLRKYGVPFVVLGGGPSDWWVTLDWDQFLRAAARELAPAGSRRIGLIGPLAYAATLAQALREAGTGEPVIADWSYETWAPVIPGAGSHENCARRVTEQMIAAAATAPLPDTLVSTEDTATRGALIALMEAGIKPGRDIRVITAANKGSPVLEAWADDLVQLAFDPTEIMQAALGMLETVMNGGKPAENPVLIRPRGVGEG